MCRGDGRVVSLPGGPRAAPRAQFHREAAARDERPSPLELLRPPDVVGLFLLYNDRDIIYIQLVIFRLGESRYRAENRTRCLSGPLQSWSHAISHKILRFKRPAPQREAPGKPPHVSLIRALDAIPRVTSVARRLEPLCRGAATPIEVAWRVPHFLAPAGASASARHALGSIIVHPLWVMFDAPQ